MEIFLSIYENYFGANFFMTLPKIRKEITQDIVKFKTNCATLPFDWFCFIIKLYQKDFTEIITSFFWSPEP